MIPYYQDDLVTIYHGDCREILPDLEVSDQVVALVTDPPWPLERNLVAGNDRAPELLCEMFAASEQLGLKRAVIVLGQKFDPRILQAVPYSLPFATVLWLRYARKVPRGGSMWEADVGYVFGVSPTTKAHHTSTQTLAWGNSRNGRLGRDRRHPCSRHPDHARWLVGSWTAPGEVVVDPFAGSGAFLAAAKALGRHVIGIELEEKYCDLCVEAVCQEVLPLGDIR